MTTPKRIQRRRTKGWRIPEGAVYVGRPTVWGNPWSRRNRSEAVALYRDWLADAGSHLDDDFDEGCVTCRLPELRGLDLACWCKLCPVHADGLALGVTCADCAPCHATVLLEMANRGAR